jgi:hypothetical protein
MREASTFREFPTAFQNLSFRKNISLQKLLQPVKLISSGFSSFFTDSWRHRADGACYGF